MLSSGQLGMVSKCEKRKGSGVEGQDVLLPVYFYEGFLVCVECPVSTSVKGVVFFFCFFFIWWGTFLL